MVLLLVAVSSTCRSRSPVLPDGATCGLGPVSLPGDTSNLCGITRTGCPSLRPSGAQTLVSVSTCAYVAGAAPCTVRATVCPLVDPKGNTPVRFVVSDTPCSSVVDVLLQSSGDGGAGVEWRVQERTQSARGCTDAGAQRVGVANVSGACCATSVELRMNNEPRIFRMSVQTDWRTP